MVMMMPAMEFHFVPLITQRLIISYSPLIELADMHSIPYPNNSFDVVISSCTLVYSTKVKKAIDEIKRVSKPGAIFAFLAHVNDSNYVNNTAKINGADVTSKNAVARQFFPINQYEILFSNFVENHLNRPMGTSSSCIFRDTSV